MTRTSVLLAAAAYLSVLTCLFGPDRISRAQEAPGNPAPAGGFMPLPPVQEPQWERDGTPIDMKSPWRKLSSDNLHGPDSYATKVLQEPEEALRGLPRASTGNFVDWVAALKSGAIKPRAEVGRAGQMEQRTNDVTFRNTGLMPIVTFSHAVHTEWLACTNCHDELFERKVGARKIRMVEIFQGKACGACHGKVAFPPDQCSRCHNGPRRSADN